MNFGWERDRMMLGPFGILLHGEYQRLDPVADLVMLKRRLLARGKDSLRPPQVDVNGVLGLPLQKAVDQIAFLVDEFIVYDVLFRFLDLLNDHLFGGLRRDPSKRFEGIFLDLDLVAQLRTGRDLDRIVIRYLFSPVPGVFTTIFFDTTFTVFWSRSKTTRTLSIMPYCFLNADSIADSTICSIFSRGIPLSVAISCNASKKFLLMALAPFNNQD